MTPLHLLRAAVRPRPARQGAVGAPSARATRWGGGASALALALVVVVAGVGTTDTAQAASYPSWDDVTAARGNESAKQSQIREIQSLISGLQSDAADAQAEAERLGVEFQKAQEAADAQAMEAADLQAQADEQDAIATASEQRAGQVTAQLARTGGGNVTTQLVGDTDGADDLLYRLGTMSKLTEQTNGIREQAVQDRNTAQSLTDKAVVARDALAKRKADAQASADAAQQASDAAAAAVAEKEANEGQLQAQLALLQDTTAQTEAGFAAGVAEAKRIAAEKAAAEAAARAQAEADARAAQAAAAAAAAAAPRPSAPAPAPVAPRPGGGGGAVAPPPAPGGSGWVRPSAGVISSGYGYRIHPITGARKLHDGTDIAASCGTPIYAAASGTVTFAAYAGGYGNYVTISHGAGVSTGYGHILNGGFRVGRGQQVQAGQLIALVGSTGGSTGCHNHFEVRINGASTDPVPFMAARGIRL